MSGSSLVHILPGRHQPPHFDHLRLIEETLKNISGELYVGLIVSAPPRGEPDTNFEREAREHQRIERAPFSFDLRRRMLEAGLAEHLSGAERKRVHVIALPRPESHFDLIQSMFPEKRVWIIPRVGEAFDELKAADLSARGEGILRIELDARISGREVRTLVEARAWRPLETMVPRSAIRVLRRAYEQGE